MLPPWTTNPTKTNTTTTATTTNSHNTTASTAAAAATTIPDVTARKRLLPPRNSSSSLSSNYPRETSSLPDPSVAAHAITLFCKGEWYNTTKLLWESPPLAVDFALLCIPGVIAMTGSAWLALHTKRVWRRQHFDNTINFPLTTLLQQPQEQQATIMNTMVDAPSSSPSTTSMWLQMRTLKETRIEDCIYGDGGVDALLRATAKYESKPRNAKVVCMPTQREANVIKNILLNEISSQFANGFLARDIIVGSKRNNSNRNGNIYSNNDKDIIAKNNVQCSQYAFCLTCGRGPFGGYKMRVVLASEATLQMAANLNRAGGMELVYEHPYHYQRFDHLLSSNA